MTKKISTKFAATKSAEVKVRVIKYSNGVEEIVGFVKPRKPRVITSVALQTPEAIAAAYAPVAPRPKHKAVTAGKKVGANTAGKKVAIKKSAATKSKTTTLDAILKLVADAAWAQHPNNLANRTITEVGQDALALIASHEEGREADAGFDAGEFSGPAHDRNLEKAMTALAVKNGFTYDQVQDEVMRLEHEDDYNKLLGAAEDARTSMAQAATQPLQDEPRGQAKKMMALSAILSAAKHHAPAPTKSPVTALTKVLDRARFQFVRAEQGLDGVVAYGYAHPDGRAALYTAHQDDVNHPETVTAKLETGQTIQVSSNQPDAAKSLWEVLKPVGKKQQRVRQARYDGERGAAELKAIGSVPNTETPEQALAVIRMVADQAEKDTAAIAAEPVNGVPAHVVRAVEILGMITGQRFDPASLTGDKNYSHRMSLLRVLLGRPVGGVKAAECGVRNLVDAFYSAIGSEGETPSRRAVDFTARCKELVTASRTIKRAVKKATKKVLCTVRRAKLPALTVPGKVLEVGKPLSRSRQQAKDAATAAQLQGELSNGRQLAQPHPALKGLVVTDAHGLRILNHKNGTVSLKLERCNSQGAMQVWDTGTRLATSVLTPALVKDVKPVMWDVNMIEMMIDNLLASKSYRIPDVDLNLKAAKVAIKWWTEAFRLTPTTLPVPAPRPAAADITINAGNVQLLEDPLAGVVFIRLEKGNSQGAAVVYNNNSAITTGICPPEWLSKFRVVTAAGGCAIETKHGHAFTDQDLARAINQLLNPETPGVAVTPTAARHLTAVLDSIEEKRIMATNANAISAGRKFAATTAATKSTKPAAVKTAATTKTVKTVAAKTERAPRTSSMAGKSIKVLNAKHEARQGSLRQIGLDIILKSKTVDAALPLLKKAGANGSFIKFAVDQKYIKLV